MARCTSSENGSLTVSTAYDALDDTALMVLVVDGNHAAFSTLVNRHTSVSLSLAARTLNNMADAEDVVQTVFVKLWQAPQAWQANKSALSTWLYKVVLNACHDLGRHRARKNTLIENVVDQTSLIKACAQSALEQISALQELDHRQQALMQAMTCLPSSQRDAINLSVFAGLSQKQVAEVLGVSVKAVEALLGRARKKLTKVIKQNSNSGRTA